MRWTRGRGLLSAALAAAAALAMMVVPPSKASWASETPNVLRAGQQLIARTANDTLQSTSGEFHLTVSPDFISLYDVAQMHGPQGPDSATTGIWFRDDGTGQHQSNRDRSTLTLRRTGDLVLATSRGVVLWSSHTSGSGSDNRLVLLDSGNLVLRTASGKTVWATHTTRVYLPAGETLASGRRLVSRWGDQQGPVHVTWSLTMKTDGNLVLSCAGSVFWQSRTHARGSYLLLQTDGNLVIRGPHGRLRWSSHTAGRGPYTYFDAIGMGVFQIDRFRPIWSGHIPYRSTPRGCM